MPHGPWRQDRSTGFEFDLQGDHRIAWITCRKEVDDKQKQQDGDGPSTELTVQGFALWLQGGFVPMPTWNTARTAPDIEGHSQHTLYVDGAVAYGTHAWAGSGTWGMYWDQARPQMLDDLMQGMAHVDAEDEGCIAYGQAA